MKIFLFIFMIMAIPVVLANFAFTGSDGGTEVRTETGGDTTTQRAMFAGGCFWCMEKPFELMDGVISVTSGYAGGTTENPTYENYIAGGHIEVVEIIYDPGRVTYEDLLDVYWRQVDPTDAGGQFVDRGHGYITGVYYYDDEQRRLAEQAKTEMDQKIGRAACGERVFRSV